MKLKLPKNAKKLIISANFIGIIIVINLFLNILPLPRLDLTANKIHTLSQSSRQTLKHLDDIINITVYMTDNLPPQAQASIDSFKNILTEISHTNPSRLIITYKNPNTDNQAKQEAVNLGIQPIQFSTVEQDSFQVNNAFLGLVVSYGQKDEVMPVVSDIGNLEYFLLSSIKKLTSDVLPTVAIATGHGQVDLSLTKNMGQYLSQTYNPTIVDTDSDDWQIPQASLLILLSPQQDFTNQDIDKFKAHLSNGGSILVLFDQFQVNQSLTATKVDTPNFSSFLKDYGFDISSTIIADESSNITTFSTQTSQFVVQYPYWLSIRPENMNSGLPVLTNISSVSLNWASPINLSGSAQYLLKSSSRSFSSQDTNLSPLQKVDYASKALSQSVVSAINTDGTKIGLISDVDFIKDEFLNNQGNLMFFLNLVDYLNSDDSLLAIRNKGLVTYPLINLTASNKLLIRWGNILLIPLSLLAVFVISKRLQAQFHHKLHA